MKPFLAIIGMLLSSVPLSATTYFMRGDGTAANKAAATSCSAASTAMNIGTHNSQTFSPGDIITMCDTGGSFTDNVMIPPSSGTSGNPITYTNSGSPIIDGADVITTWTVHSGNVWQATVPARNLNWVFASGVIHSAYKNGLWQQQVGSLAGVIAEGEWFWDSASTVYYYTTGNPNTYTMQFGNRDVGIFGDDRSFITYQNLTVQHANFGWGIENGALTTSVSNVILTNITTIRNTNGAFQGLVSASACAGPCTLSNITINGLNDLRSGLIGNSGESVGFGGVDGQAEGTVSNVTVSNITVSYYGVADYAGGFGTGHAGIGFRYVTTGSLTGCQVDHSSTSGVDIQYASSGITISGCSIFNNGLSTVGDDNGIEIGLLGNGTSSIVITKNDVYNNYNSAFALAATATSQVASGVTISYNRFHGSTSSAGNGQGVQIGGGHTGVVVEYNLIYGNADYGYSHTQGTSGSPSVLFYGNTIYGNGVGGVNTANVFVNGNNLTFNNNITSQATGLEMSLAATFTLTSDYNDFYHAAGGNFMSYQGTAGTFAQWKTASSQDSHSISTDPTFTNAGGNIFTVNAGSPTIGAGVTLGGTYQNALSSNSTWPSGIVLLSQPAIWNLGAFINSSSMYISTGAFITTGMELQ